MKKSIIEDNDVDSLNERFSLELKVNSLTELALSNFNLTYEIQDMKSKFLTLMICLESLFNQGSDQISHTVSRHLAIILANSPEEFHAHYSRIKKLYKFRSKIVHSYKLEEDIVSLTEELQNLVRQAINYCLKVEKTKEESFQFLNAKGF